MALHNIELNKLKCVKIFFLNKCSILNLFENNYNNYVSILDDVKIFSKSKKKKRGVKQKRYLRDRLSKKVQRKFFSVFSTHKKKLPLFIHNKEKLNFEYRESKSELLNFNSFLMETVNDRNLIMFCHKTFSNISSKLICGIGEKLVNERELLGSNILLDEQINDFFFIWKRHEFG